MPVDVLAVVVANTRLSADYHVLAFDAPALAQLARPGQFVMIKTMAGLEPLLRRPFSFFEILRDTSGRATGFSILGKRVGIGTAQLYDARPGDRLACLGPLGVAFDLVAPPVDAWMVAGGVGLAPFPTLGTALLGAGVRPTLFYGARSAADLHGLDVFARLGVPVVTSTEDGSAGVRGLVTGPVRDALAARPPGQALQIYACGPTPMMHAVASLAAAAGRPCAVSLEQVMGCGMGGCYSCVVRVRGAQGGAPHFVRSCTDGPVFDGRDVVWDELVH